MSGTDVLMLHGFSGSGRSWERVAAELDGERYRPLAPDLPGHGVASAVGPLNVDACVAWVLDRAPPRFVLAGYSMGGRIALHLALAAPERVQGLVLVSATAGLEGEAERAARREADERLARELEKVEEGEEGDFDAWIERWRAQPLFAADPAPVRDWAAREQRRNDPRALAAVLRVLGAGAVPAVWNRLPELPLPVTIVVGDRDERYRAIGARMAQLLPDATVEVVPGGHTLLGEAPRPVANAIAEVLAVRRTL